MNGLLMTAKGRRIVLNAIKMILFYSWIYKARYWLLKKRTGFGKIEKLWQSIYPQLLLPTEACALYKLARESKGPIVEIGSYVGGSTVLLAEGSARGHRVPVYAIDPHLAYESEGLNLPSTAFSFELSLTKTFACRFVTAIYGYSEKVVEKVPDGIGLLFVDGDHSFEAVRKDLSLYKNKVAVDGLIALHDFKKQGVSLAVDAQLKWRWEMVGRTKTLAVFRRKKVLES